MNDQILTYREWLARAPLWLVCRTTATDQRRQSEYKKYLLAAQAAGIVPKAPKESK